MPRLRVMNPRIPMQHEMYSEVEKFTAFFLRFPLLLSSSINVQENRIRGTTGTYVTVDRRTCILTNFKSQVHAHRPLRNCAQECLQGFLRPIPRVVVVILRVNAAEFVCRNKLACGGDY